MNQIAEPGINKNNKSKEQVVIGTTTWKRDRHGLFDHEAENIVKTQHKPTVEGLIYRVDKPNSVYFKALKNQISTIGEDTSELAILLRDKEGFYLDHAEKREGEEESVDRLWLVASSLENQAGKYDYQIEKFDTIRVGRVRLRVKDFRCNGKQMSSTELHNQELKEAKAVTTLADIKK